MGVVFQKNAAGVFKRGEHGNLLTPNDDGSCCCDGTGPCVVIRFSGVTFAAPGGGTVNYWLVCGELNGRYFITPPLDDVVSGSCDLGGDGGGSAVYFPGISIEGLGTLATGSPPYEMLFTATNCFISIFRCDTGWQIELSALGNLPSNAAEPNFVIFRGTAPYVTTGSTTASNQAGGWTGFNSGDPTGADPAQPFDIGSGGTATITFGAPCYEQTDDAACLCDGINRSKECFDLVVVHKIIGGVETYQVILAYDIFAGRYVPVDGSDPENPVYGDPVYTFDLPGGGFIMPRTDCCSVAGTYAPVNEYTTGTAEVLLAANVEEAHVILHVTGGDIPITLLREVTAPGNFIGFGGIYKATVYLDATTTPLWTIIVEQAGVLKLTATLAFSPGGTSFAGTYDVISSTIPGITASDTVTVTT